jgi:hypothetical protein
LFDTWAGVRPTAKSDWFDKLASEPALTLSPRYSVSVSDEAIILLQFLEHLRTDPVVSTFRPDIYRAFLQQMGSQQLRDDGSPDAPNLTPSDPALSRCLCLIIRVMQLYAESFPITDVKSMLIKVLE